MELPSSTLVAEVQPTVKDHSRVVVASMGVHHPKFIVLVAPEALLVVVSTSNIAAGGRTVEGSWVQAFPRCGGESGPGARLGDPTADAPVGPADLRCEPGLRMGRLGPSPRGFSGEWDFGRVLFDMLRRQVCPPACKLAALGAFFFLSKCC